MKVDVKQELIDLGLNPGSWQDSLTVIKSVLAPKDWDKFNRLHKNFISYRSETTLTAFYNFVFTHDLHLEINRQRFKRISGILEVLLNEVRPGLKILDIGAGSGIMATLLKRYRNPTTYFVQDLSPMVQDYLEGQGFQVLSADNQNPITPPQFDLILCIDSLGEINADEDGLLSETSDLSETEYALLLEQRYGIKEKLNTWKRFLSKEGRILFWEPFKHSRALKSLNEQLKQEGWDVNHKEDDSGRPYLTLKIS